MCKGFLKLMLLCEALISLVILNSVKNLRDIQSGYGHFHVFGIAALSVTFFGCLSFKGSQEGFAVLFGRQKESNQRKTLGCACFFECLCVNFWCGYRTSRCRILRLTWVFAFAF